MNNLTKEQEELAIQYKPLVFHIAKKYMDIVDSYEDLVGEGMIGLVEGALRYDPKTGKKPGTFIGSYIRGYMLKYINLKMCLIHTPAYVQNDSVYVYSYDTPIVNKNGEEQNEAFFISTVDDFIDGVILKHDFEKALKKLPKSGRQLFSLLAEGYTAEEIAKLKNVSKQSIYALRKEQKYMLKSELM